MSEIEKNSAYDKLTPQKKAMLDKVMNHLENGKGFWDKGWIGLGVPESATTGKRYHGMNSLYLSMYAMERGYTDTRWATYHQIEEHGWHFKKDEEGKNLGKNVGVTIEFFELRDKETKKPFDRSVLDGMTKDEQQEYIDQNVYPLRKYYRVFNGDIIEGIPKQEKRQIDTSGTVERAENLLAYWNDNEARIEYGGDDASYNRVLDRIRCPQRDCFKNLHEFYGTLFHEIGHSTGHEKRLNRDLSGRFGTESYALEELRAELSAMFLEQDMEIAVSDKHIENNSRYIKSWYDLLKADPNALFTAIADADKISRYVMAKEQEYKQTEMSEAEDTVQEDKPIYELPSVVAAKAVARSKPVNMAERGVESLTKLSDVDVVERAKREGGETFDNLYNGKSVFGDGEKDERALMLRIAVFCNGDKEQLLRIFKSSGQYHDEKPNAFYESMAKQSIEHIARLDSGKAITQIGGNASKKHYGLNSKT